MSAPLRAPMSRRGVLRLRIVPEGGVNPAAIDFAPLRLFLNFHNDPIAGLELRLLLRNHVRSVHFTPRGARPADPLDRSSRFVSNSALGRPSASRWARSW